MNNRLINIVILIASALILLLEISIFVSFLPAKLTNLEAYKKQVNSSLSDKDFIEELISQNYYQKSQIMELETSLANKDILISYLDKKLNTSSGIEASPFKRIGREDVKVYNDRVVILVNKAFTASFTGSKSMYPFINQEVYALEVRPKNQSELQVGDVIGFESSTFNTTIIHRIIEIGADEEGWYAVTKGDNNAAADPGKARFEDIEGVLVGLIY